MIATIHRVGMRVSGVGLVACLCGTVAFASASAQNAAQTSTPGGSQQAAQTPADKLDALVKRFDEQEGKAYRAYSAAQTDEARAEALKLRPGKEYIGEFRDLALSARGTDTAASAWLWVIEVAGTVDKESSQRALDVLLAEHLQSPKLEELAPKLGGVPSAVRESVLNKLLDGSPHAAVKASALYALASIALGSVGDPAKLREAKELFSWLEVDYRDVRTARGSTYGAVAERSLYELDHLQVGMVAPDFDAVDQNGAAYKLSDYRGKVLAVIFWGFW